MEALVKSIQSSNAVRYAIDEALEHVEKGLDAISAYQSADEYESLAGLARYIVDRTS